MYGVAEVTAMGETLPTPAEHSAVAACDCTVLYCHTMGDITPAPEALDDLLVSQVDSPEGGLTVEQRRDAVRAENAVAAAYWGGFQPRIVVTFLVFAAAWVWVVVAGVTGAMPLWAGLLVNTVLATTFYMPMHEATHKNIRGRQNRLRALEDVIGVLCSVPTGINFAAHRSSHMRHHAHTNDPGRDPDHFTHGAKGELALKFVGMTLLFSLLPVFALVRPARVLLPAAVRRNLDGESGSPRDGKAQIRFWLLCTVVLAVSFATGHGAEALLLWWIPARLQLGWLARPPRDAPSLPARASLQAPRTVVRTGRRHGRARRADRGTCCRCDTSRHVVIR